MATREPLCHWDAIQHMKLATVLVTLRVMMSLKIVINVILDIMDRNALSVLSTVLMVECVMMVSPTTVGADAQLNGIFFNKDILFLEY